jgi:hypothetical protein
MGTEDRVEEGQRAVRVNFIQRYRLGTASIDADRLLDKMYLADKSIPTILELADN